MTNNRILLVEDNRSIKDIYKRILEEEGFEVSAVEDGFTAQQEIKNGEWDLLLLDIMLPKLDGLSLLKDLMKDPDLSCKPVLIISNVNEPEFINQCIQLGVREYIIKAEVLPSDILDHVVRYLSSK